MQDMTVLSLFFSIIPALLVGLVSYYFFNQFFDNEEKRRLYLLRKENQKEALPLRLQAFERLTIFLERIDPGNLMVRVKPYNDSKHDYENLLIKSIEQEFEHNLSQQIYVSQECWNAIRATKNATISLLRKANMSEKVDSPNKLREVVLTELIDHDAPSVTGLAYIKQEAHRIF